jgi:hypothetical protein
MKIDRNRLLIHSLVQDKTSAMKACIVGAALPSGLFELFRSVGMNSEL